MPVDALGNLHAPVAAGEAVRIVSLVPSLTELLCDLGLHAHLVGRTGFCIHPRDLVREIPKVGGTKDVDIERIRALAPTHLVVNIDENEKPTVAALAECIPHVLVTHPQAPSDNLQLYRFFGALFGAVPGVAARACDLCERFDAVHAALHASLAGDAAKPLRVLYCIWKDPWMTVSRETYIARMLALVGWEQWQQGDAPDRPGAPGGRSGRVRYPCFDWSQDVTAAIDMVLLSTEPYRFTQRHADMLAQRTGKPVCVVDGEMLSWYGSRAIAGLAYLQALRATSGGSCAPACE